MHFASLTTLCAALLAAAAPSHAAPADAPPAAVAAIGPVSQYLTIEAGTLPIVLSVPHGGDDLIAGVPLRTSGTTVRDDHVNALAEAIQQRLFTKTGKRAYLVGAKVSRKFVDFNRDPAKAYEDPAIKPLYDAYYDALRADVAAVRGKPGALLIDVHGQSAVRDALLRGTKDGVTADSTPLYGPNGVFTQLMAAGVKVVPPTAAEKEHPGFNGGAIVRTFGRNTPGGIDSVQFEFGANWRATPEQIALTAAAVGDALVAWLKENKAL
jgi:N-formylglutamate amidohydrolase